MLNSDRLLSYAFSHIKYMLVYTLIYYIDRNNKSNHLCDFMLWLIATLFKKLVSAVLIGMV